MRYLSSQVHYTSTSIFLRSALLIVHNFIIGRSRLYKFCHYQAHNISARYLCISVWRDWFDSSGCLCINTMWACVIEDRADGTWTKCNHHLVSALPLLSLSPTFTFFNAVFNCVCMCVISIRDSLYLYTLCFVCFRLDCHIYRGPALLYSDFSFSQLLTAYKLYPHV